MSEPESAADLWTERSLFAGTTLGCVSYGIHLCVFTATFYYMLPSTQRALSRQRNPHLKHHPSSALRQPTFWSFLYLWVVFALGTCQAGGNIKFFEKMWIGERDIEGGPVGWYTNHFGDPVNTFASVAYIMATLLQDGMLLYRLLVVWSFWYPIAIIPLLALLASTALSILVVYQSSRPNAGLWTTITISVTVPYFAISIGLNIAMTLAIAGRMLYMRRTVISVLGPEHARLYTSVASMFIESGAVYSVLGLIFLVSYARGSNVQNLVLQSLDQAVCISPELILLRVALGRAWSYDTTVRTSTFVATSCDDDDDTSSGSRANHHLGVKFADPKGTMLSSLSATDYSSALSALGTTTTGTVPTTTTATNTSDMDLDKEKFSHIPKSGVVVPLGLTIDMDLESGLLPNGRPAVLSRCELDSSVASPQSVDVQYEGCFVERRSLGGEKDLEAGVGVSASGDEGEVRSRVVRRSVSEADVGRRSEK